MKTVGIGFDIRQPEINSIKMWTEDVRKKFLLKEDTRFPLTVDTNMWDSVFLYNERENAGLDYNMISAFKCEEIEPDHKTLGVWDDFIKMEQYFIECAAKNSVGIEIYIEILANKEKWDDFIERVVFSADYHTAKMPNDWVFLGCDIADSAYMSGLTNCEYGENRKRELINVGWLNKLNEHGLIKDIDDAIEFKKIMNKQKPAMAPFYVFKLYKAPDVIEKL